MSLVSGDLPRHKVRVFNSVASTPAGADYRRFLNYLASSASRQPQAILGGQTQSSKPLRTSQICVQEPHPNSSNEPESDEQMKFLEYAAGLLESWFTDDESEDTETCRLGESSIVEINSRSSEDPLALLSRLKSAGEVHSSADLPVTTLARNVSRMCGSRALECKPRVVPLKDGTRREIYPNGAYVVKSPIGRVKEVRGAMGVFITLGYDQHGDLVRFTRTDMFGNIHSQGHKDKHGVTVHDSSGRVRAQGESMSVDARGCLCIRRFDGQFWSFDLVREVHVERRILQDTGGSWNSLTALLTADGFRMATRFQRLKEEYRRYGDWLSDNLESKFRFYGRDGSVIQFDGDEELQGLRPSRIWPPGAKEIDAEWVGLRQAGTAWDSVNQYVSQYLSCL